MTKFRAMLAPINKPTGDGRRFAVGALTAAPVPFPFEWARSREGGHDGAVVIGAVQALEIGDDAIWATGTIFDDVDRETMPRLAEDVAEALKLIEEGTLGPSVDLDNFEGIPVMEGTDNPITWEDIEAYYEEHGEEPPIELLVTEGRVRAATLVSIPAFQETSVGFELLPDEEPAEGEEVATTAALIASVGVATRPMVAAFVPPGLTGPTPITFDFDRGTVFGHIATWKTCHVGYSDVCVTPPRDESGAYSAFNRFAVDTEDGGTIWAGRITVGGRHAGLSASAAQAMSVYDSKTVAAHVRAYEDEFGLAVVGPIEPDLDDATKRVLSRRKVSGDWRETPAGLSLIEVLALSPGPRAHAEPGFPVGTFSRAGRQVALTASFGPVAEGFLEVASVDVGAAVRLELDRREAASALAALVKVQADQERAVLVAALGEGV